MATQTIFSKNYSFNMVNNDVDVVIKQAGKVFLFAQDEWDSIEEICEYIQKRWIQATEAAIIVADIKAAFAPVVEVVEEKSIAKFEEVLDGKIVQIEAVVSGTTLEYHRLNKKGDRVEIANNEGFGFLMAEKNADQNFVFGSQVIHKTHYANPKQFFAFLKSLAKFNYTALHSPLV